MAIKKIGVLQNIVFLSGITNISDLDHVCVRFLDKILGEIRNSGPPNINIQFFFPKSNKIFIPCSPAVFTSSLARSISPNFSSTPSRETGQ